MKRFLLLLKLEYDGMFLPLSVILTAMTVLQLALFGRRLQRAGATAPLSYVIDIAGIDIVFAIAFICILILMAARLVRNYMPSKSIYALLTLPVSRRHIYLAKLTATFLAGAVLTAAQMALLLIFSMLMGMRSADSTGVEAARRGADLYLSLLDVNFLRMLFPPDLFSFVFSVAGFLGSVCVGLYVAVGLKSGRRYGAVLIGVFWLAIMLFSFPLSDYVQWANIFKLLVMIIIICVAGLKGSKLFESSEVAG